MLLACPNCQAPLPPPTSSAADFVTCLYCGATTSVGAGSFGALAPVAPAKATATYEERSKAATATFQRVLATNGTAEDACWYAARDLAVPDVDAGEIAYGAIALARDFDAQHRTQTLRDAMCMIRLLEVYARATLHVRSAGRFDLNLPFFTATKDGPLHYARELDAGALAQLLASVRPA